MTRYSTPLEVIGSVVFVAASFVVCHWLGIVMGVC